MQPAAGSLEMQGAIEMNMAARHPSMGGVVNHETPIGRLDHLDSVGESQVFRR